MKFNYNLLILFALGLCTSCAPTTGSRQVVGNTTAIQQLENSFQVIGQQQPPVTIRSVSLFSGRVGNAPIIRLHSSETITLQFDELSTETNPFRVTISHHNADWSISNLLPNLYLQGFQEDYVQSGTPGRFQNPSFVSYSYTFPNANMRVTRSGNYLMHVYRMDTGDYLFSQPFLIYEDGGQVRTELETLFNSDVRYLRHHQLFARYLYDGVVIVPQVDLQVYFVQNQFWSQARKADQMDFSQDGTGRFYLSREQAFVGTFDYLQLDLDRIDNYSMQVVEYRQDLRIPRVTLNRDVVNLNSSPTLRSLRGNRGASSRNDARYALVRFQLEIPSRLLPASPIYVVGEFNNWGIHPLQRMQIDSETGYFTTEAIVKEGQYSYKYVSLEGNRLNDLRFDASFASTVQEYHTLVYQRDQTFQIDRLVAIQRLFSEP